VIIIIFAKVLWRSAGYKKYLICHVKIIITVSKPVETMNKILSLALQILFNLPIIIYSDGCGHQNRNCVMSNALPQYSIAKNVVIEQKCLIKGHTQMECDSAHSLIERKLKNKDIPLRLVLNHIHLKHFY